MAKKKPTRMEELQDYAKSVGLHVATWSPGDGTTRYRFFDKPGNTYFGPASGIATELGIKNAWNFLYSYGAGRASKRSHATRSTGSTKHARTKKIDHHEAKRLLESEGIDFTRDFYEISSMSRGERIAEVARQAGYRKRKDAPGSTARMYFQYLSRLK